MSKNQVIKPTEKDIKTVLRLAQKYCPTSPGNLFTYMKEWQMCFLMNERYPGADYEVGEVFNQRGVDLIDMSGRYPMIQYKGASDKQYKLGGSDIWSDECKKALKEDSEALFLFDFRRQNLMYIGKAELLTEHHLTVMSYKHAERLGFQPLYL